MSTKLGQIAKKAKLDRNAQFTSLAHLLTPAFLKETWRMMFIHAYSTPNYLRWGTTISAASSCVSLAPDSNRIADVALRQFSARSEY